MEQTRPHRLAWLLIGVWAMGPTLSARAADPATMANAGSNGQAPCASCHGQDGGGQASFPRLAGLNAAYLEHQLDSFANGTRLNPVMEPVAKALAPRDRAAMAAYYAAMPVPPKLVRKTPSPAGDRSVGARLAREGAWNRGVPACEQCHARGGAGVGTAFPPVTGQPAAYLSGQLNAWRSGTRKNDRLQLMRTISEKLTQEEVSAVSEWLAQQPAHVADVK